ncbi:MAG: hypothetical protein FJ144_21120 [Deltaproteobacteria bacterium]|nr:hypothetical protein [Deltaproteobacteria bacterium]
MTDGIRSSWVGPREIRRALRALGEVAKDPNRTDSVGEFIAALTGPSAVRLFERVWDDPTGRRLLEEKCDLKATLDDRASLATLPAGSLGRVYHDWTADRHLSAEGIAAAISAQVPRTLETPYAVMAARVVDMHDIWHVLNGWDTDIHGEIHLLGYSHAQLGAYAWLLLALPAVVILSAAGRRDSVGYLRNAIRRGRRASLLAAVDWEAMLPLPIDEVRRRLGIDEPESYRKLDSAEIAEVGSRSRLARLLRTVLAN